MELRSLKKLFTALLATLSFTSVAFGATGGLLNRQQEVRIVLPKPKIRFEVNLPVPEPVLQIIDQIQGNIAPSLCPAPQRNEPICNLDSIDVSSPSNDFDLIWRCDGVLRPCALYSNGQPVGSVRGSGTAHLTLPSSIGTYELKDRNDRSCGAVVIHGFKSSGAVPLTTPSPAPAATPTYGQAAYRWFTNADSATPGSAAAALNTAYHPSFPNRLRILLLVTTADASAGADNFKLQWGLIGDTDCSDSSYSDLVQGSGTMQYYDNATPSDGAAISSTAEDPTDGANTVVPQTYEEANNFTNSSTISSGQDGEWDFAIDQPSFTFGTYCFRVVKSDGTLLDTYDNYPELFCNGEGSC